MRRVFLVLLACFLFVSCRYFELRDEADQSVTSVSFQRGDYSVKVGGLTGCYISSDPPEAVASFSAEFSVSDSSVARVTKEESGYCLVEGRKAGTAILKCELLNRKCEAVITVSE